MRGRPHHNRNFLPTVIASASLFLPLLTSCIKPETAPVEIPPEFTGSQSCTQCHTAETEAWRTSDHALAMQTADEHSIPPDLRDSSVVAFDETFAFQRREKKLFVTVTSKDSAPRDFEVKFTFGVRPLQQYLVAFAKGKMQGLPVAWDTQRKLWFNLTPDSTVPPDDWYHWTRGGQNWNAQCADCHSTGLRRNYVPERDSFQTDFKEINVSCEACHGPGSRHVAWAGKSPEAREKFSGLIAPLRGESTTVQMESCAPCHSRRMPLRTVPDPGGKFLDNYQPELIRPGLYHPDGHFLEEDYEYGSFLQSKMYRHGVKCSDCHEPHGLKIRRPGNSLCTECHKPETFDVPSHHRHKTGSPGASCIECHMPGKLYMQVDYRRDHSMRIPRPDLSVKLGTPNACNDCHKDKKPEWAAQWIVNWFGPERKPHFAEAFDLGWSHRPGGDSALAAIARDSVWNPVVRASALEALGDYLTALAAAAKVKGVSDAEPLVRMAAARAMAREPGETRRTALPPLLQDSIRAVRLAAVNSLLDLGPLLDSSFQTPFRNGLWEQQEVLQANAYFPSSHFNAGLFHARLGNQLEAKHAYEKTLEMDHRFNPARMNLAQLLAVRGELRLAESHLRKAIFHQPNFGDAHYSLGLALAEQGILDSASAYLRRAAELLPGQARVVYNLALSLQKGGQNSEAERAFLHAIRLEPASPDFLYALAILYVQTRQREKALQIVSILATQFPQHPGLSQLLQTLGRIKGD